MKIDNKDWRHDIQPNNALHYAIQHNDAHETIFNMRTHRIFTFRITMISIIILRIMTSSVINFVKGLLA